MPSSLPGFKVEFSQENVQKARNDWKRSGFLKADLNYLSALTSGFTHLFIPIGSLF
jgi:hypothetical protein